jgi:hypothetical protein
MKSLKDEYQALSIAELESLLKEAALTPEAIDLCRSVINEKSGEKRYDVESVGIIEKDIEYKTHEKVTEDSNQVVITDIKMPFMSMVVFMVKAAIAAIPAFFILFVIGAILISVLGGISGGFGRY